jgi:hypothetical protein
MLHSGCFGHGKNGSPWMRVWCNGRGRAALQHQETFKSVVKSRAMTVWKKLQNPFALVGQGFVLGGLIFFAAHQADASSPQAGARHPAQHMTR